MQATSSAARLALPFREAGTAQHRAFAATNGDDPAWPAWYARPISRRTWPIWPVCRSRGTTFAADLVIVDRLHRETGRGAVAEYYMEWFLQRFARAMTPVAAF